MSVENGSRMGKVTAAVLEAYRKDLPRSAILAATDCKPSSIWNAVLNAKNHISPEEQELFAEWRRENRWLERPTHHRLENFRHANSEAHGGVRNKSIALLLRGLSHPEVSYIKGLRPEQTYQVKASLIDQELLPPGRPHENRRRDNKIRRFLAGDTSAGPFYDLDFIKKLDEAGLVTADLTNWQELHQLYKERELPQSPASIIILEGFLMAWKGVVRGDNNLFSKYTTRGVAVDHDWFMSTLNSPEVAFIMSKVVNDQGYGRDRRGRFRLGPNEEKLRDLLTGRDNGGLKSGSASSTLGWQ